MGISLPSRDFLFLLKATTVLLRLALAKAVGLARGLIFELFAPELVDPLAPIFCPYTYYYYYLLLYYYSVMFVYSFFVCLVLPYIPCVYMPSFMKYS